jgi:hypothetical protein
MLKSSLSCCRLANAVSRVWGKIEALLAIPNDKMTYDRCFLPCLSRSWQSLDDLTICDASALFFRLQ